MKTGCPDKATPLTFARGGLPADQAAAFEAHCRACPACRAAADEAGCFLARMREWPDREPARDLVEGVMARVAVLPVRRRFRVSALLAAAAAVLILAVGGYALWWRQDPRLVAIREASRWLATSQRADGSWAAPGRSGEAYEPALTGLGLLAAMNLPPDSRLVAARDRAARWLLAQQRSDGLFGPAFSGSPYNQGIVTLALLNWSAERTEPLPPGAIRAVERIMETQDASGGWGYAEGDPVPNVSITIWQLQALRQAEAMGYEAATPALRRGLRWLRTTRNGEGLYGYRRPDDYPEGPSTLTAMSVFCELDCDSQAGKRPEIRRSIAEVLRQASGATPQNYYAAYFVTRVLRKAGEAGSEAVLEQVHRSLLAQQEREGDGKGSWAAADSYTDVGGSVYATTMAALSLRD